jgi:hypothetical protein
MLYCHFVKCTLYPFWLPFLPFLPPRACLSSLSLVYILSSLLSSSPRSHHHATALPPSPSHQLKAPPSALLPASFPLLSSLLLSASPPSDQPIHHPPSASSPHLHNLQLSLARVVHRITDLAARFSSRETRCHPSFAAALAVQLPLPRP